MFIAPLLSGFLFHQTKTIDSDFYFADSKAGTNHVETTGNHIDSVSQLNLQGLDIKSHVTVDLVDGKPTSFTFEETLKQGDKTLRSGNVIVKDGKATVIATAGAKPTESSVTLGWPMFTNFHPHLSCDLYRSIKWDQKTKQEASAFMPEALKSLTLSMTPLDPKSVKLDQGTVNLRTAEVALGAVKFNMIFTDQGDYLGMDVPSQKFRVIRRGYEKIFEDPLAKFKELSQPEFESQITETDIPMRDGVMTRATLIRPNKPGKYPVILQRTPYNRKMALDSGPTYARRGYVVVVQDVRGTGESKGAFDPMMSERKDGYDTIDWISKQDWCDGNVGMIGASYGGFVQWAAAVEHHPALKCIIPQVSPPSSAMWNLPYENGVFTLLSDLWWLRIVDNPEGQNLLGALSEIPNMKALGTLPLDQADNKLLGFNSKIFSTWLKRDTSTQWSMWNFDDLMGTVKIPALHISGWFDGDEIGTQRNWKFVTEGGNDKQWLIYGPWTHFFNTTSKLGNIDFGKDAILELDSLYLRWFDTWLKGKTVGLAEVPRVRYFVMSQNQWHTSTAWPPTESKTEELKFEFGKVNVGSKSVARLVPTLKKDSMNVLTYDPSKDKVAMDSLTPGDTGGDAYTRRSDLKKSQIVLRSDPFDRDRIVTGPVTVEFDFKTSAKDTDFYAAVFDEDPARGLFPVFRPGKLKASYLEGLDKQRFLTPGKTYHAKLQLWDGANQFKKGHRMVVFIVNSLFPATARNLGTSEPILSGTKMVSQRNVIFSTVKGPGLVRYRVID